LTEARLPFIFCEEGKNKCRQFVAVFYVLLKTRPTLIDMHQDPDFDWLSAHLPQKDALPERQELAERIAKRIHERVNKGDLPHTLGVFGGWGSGKTTFLALLAKELGSIRGARIIYFNSWKYAGLSEIVPSLIYKILKQGVPDTDQKRNRAAMRVLASLGKEYSDKLGEWAEQRIGVNPVQLFKDVTTTVSNATELVPSKILEAYYTQVDKAQDALAEALDTVKLGERVENPVIILIDELDRCDPDEAFTVIKQLRVLFAMRRLPTAFVVCANPEPIGLAIKHRYGLESEAGDYEARRILEKFVDAYEDFSESVALGKLAKSLWAEAGPFPTPWIIAMDEANGDVGYIYDTTRNPTVFDMMDSSIPYYSNLRVFRKSLDYVKGGHGTNLIWTLWHLKLAEQVDPKLRMLLRTIASPLRRMTVKAYQFIEGEVHFHVNNKRLVYETDKGNTLFAVLRSRLWETGHEELKELVSQNTPQDLERQKALQQLLADDRKMNFVTSLCLLHIPKAPEFNFLKNSGQTTFGTLLKNELHQFAHLVRYA
jgi:hypothetical protein